MVKITDIRGVDIDFDSPPHRIVSLVPSLTETVIDLGCRDSLVGITRYCLEIDGTDGIAVIGGVMDPDIDKIRELEPDLVLTGREENQPEDVGEIEGFSRVHVCQPGTVADVIGLLTDYGKLFGKVDESNDWCERIINAQVRLRILRESKKKIRYSYIVWWNPLYLAGGGGYISNLLGEGPFENVFEEVERYPVINEEVLYSKYQDVIFASSEPYSFSEEILSKIEEESGRSVMEIDGRKCGWYGTGTLKGLEYLLNFAEKFC